MPIHAINYGEYITPSDYLKFEEGETTIRVISKGGLCKMHGMKTARGFINLGICPENDTCENCKKNYEAKTRWIWVVYLPAYDVVRLLEVGKKVGDAICKLGRKNGDPQAYDLIVTRIGQDLKTDYTVRMGKTYPLADEVIEKVKPAKEFLVKKHFK